jgi:hypothetical protein
VKTYLPVRKVCKRARVEKLEPQESIPYPKVESHFAPEDEGK